MSHEIYLHNYFHGFKIRQIECEYRAAFVASATILKHLTCALFKAVALRFSVMTLIIEFFNLMLSYGKQHIAKYVSVYMPVFVILLSYSSLAALWWLKSDSATVTTHRCYCLLPSGYMTDCLQ